MKMMMKMAARGVSFHANTQERAQVDVQAHLPRFKAETTGSAGALHRGAVVKLGGKTCGRVLESGRQANAEHCAGSYTVCIVEHSSGAMPEFAIEQVGSDALSALELELLECQQRCVTGTILVLEKAQRESFVCWVSIGHFFSSSFEEGGGKGGRQSWILDASSPHALFLLQKTESTARRGLDGQHVKLMAVEPAAEAESYLDRVIVSCGAEHVVISALEFLPDNIDDSASSQGLQAAGAQSGAGNSQSCVPVHLLLARPVQARLKSSHIAESYGVSCEEVGIPHLCKSCIAQAYGIGFSCMIPSSRALCWSPHNYRFLV